MSILPLSACLTKPLTVSTGLLITAFRSPSTKATAPCSLPTHTSLGSTHQCLSMAIPSPSAGHPRLWESLSTPISPSPPPHHGSGRQGHSDTFAAATHSPNRVLRVKLAKISAFEQRLPRAHRTTLTTSLRISSAMPCGEWPLEVVHFFHLPEIPLHIPVWGISNNNNNRPKKWVTREI